MGALSLERADKAASQDDGAHRRPVQLAARSAAPGRRGRRHGGADWHMPEPRQEGKAAGGRWDPTRRVWGVGREFGQSLGLESRRAEGSL